MGTCTSKSNNQLKITSNDEAPSSVTTTSPSLNDSSGILSDILSPANQNAPLSTYYLENDEDDFENEVVRTGFVIGGENSKSLCSQSINEIEIDDDSENSINISVSCMSSKYQSIDDLRFDMTTSGPKSRTDDMSEEGKHSTRLTPKKKINLNELNKRQRKRYTSLDKYSSEEKLFGSIWGRTQYGSIFEVTHPDGKYCNCGLNEAEIITIASGPLHTVGVNKIGEVFGCGKNTEGQVQPGNCADEFRKPVFIGSLILQKIVSVACGNRHTCVLTSNGIVITFGSNECGQLGHSPELSGHVQPLPVEGIGKDFIKQVACGNTFTLLLNSQGEVFSMGNTELTGNNNQFEQWIPSRINALFGVPINFISACADHSLVVSQFGEVYGWGDNSHKQLGIEKKDHVIEPTRIPKIRDILRVACGESHSLFLQLSGKVYGAGRNIFNALGVPNREIVCPAMLIKKVSNIIRVVCGKDHSVMLTRAGGLICMGKNNFNQLGYYGPLHFENVDYVEHPTGPCGRKVLFINAGGDQTVIISAGKSMMKLSDASSRVKLQSLDDLITQHNSAGYHNFDMIKQPKKFLDTKQLITLAKKAKLTSDSVELLEMINYAFSSVIILNGSFFTDPNLSHSRIDVNELEHFYIAVIKLEKKVIETLMDAIIRALDEYEKILREIHPYESQFEELSYASALRFFLMILQVPVVNDSELANKFFEKRAWFMAYIPMVGREWIRTCIALDYSPRLFADRLFLPTKKFFDKIAPSLHGNGELCHPCIALLDCFYAVNGDAEFIPFDKFYSNTISAFSPEVIFNDLSSFKACKSRKKYKMDDFFFCSRPYLLDPPTKKRLLQDEAKAEQNKVGVMDALEAMMAGHEASPHFILEIRRDYFINDVFTKLSTISVSELRKELRISFIGEDGYDFGGVQREFFQLLPRKLVQREPNGFITNDETRFAWFNPLCEDLEYFKIIGTLMGLAVYNGDIFDLRFPPALYRKLLNESVGFIDLEQVDPSLYYGLQQLLNYNELEESIEDVFCRTFEASLELQDGTYIQHELKPNGREIYVTKHNRDEFVNKYSEWILETSITTQFQAFVDGFIQVLKDVSLDLLRADELELIMCGVPELNFKELEEVAQYEGFDPNDTIIIDFWEIVQQDFDIEMKKRLLMFVTGNTRAPVGGLGKLSFTIQRNGPDSNLLPTSHTCFNVLMMPDYSSRDKLKKYLSLSLSECEGFGLI